MKAGKLKRAKKIPVSDVEPTHHMIVNMEDDESGQYLEPF